MTHRRRVVARWSLTALTLAVAFLVWGRVAYATTWYWVSTYLAYSNSSCQCDSQGHVLNSLVEGQGYGGCLATSSWGSTAYSLCGPPFDSQPGNILVGIGRFEGSGSFVSWSTATQTAWGYAATATYSPAYSCSSGQSCGAGSYINAVGFGETNP